MDKNEREPPWPSLLVQIADTQGIPLLFYDKCLIHEVFHCSSMTNAWYTRYLIALLWQIPDTHGLTMVFFWKMQFLRILWHEKGRRTWESLLLWFLAKVEKGLKWNFAILHSPKKKNQCFFLFQHYQLKVLNILSGIIILIIFKKHSSSQSLKLQTLT